MGESEPQAAAAALVGSCMRARVCQPGVTKVNGSPGRRKLVGEDAGAWQSATFCRSTKVGQKKSCELPTKHTPKVVAAAAAAA